jgi:AraC-like DNA-binding protein
MLRYQEYAPAADLAGLVRCYWSLSGDASGAPPERIIPDGRFDIVFHRGDPFLRNGERQPAAMLVGEIRRPVVVQPAGRVDVFGVRFRLGGLSAFVRDPARELRDMILPLNEIVRAPLPEEVGSFLRSRRSSPRALRLARAAINVIRRTPSIRSRRLASILGTTERTLERAFGQCIGMTPKQFARLTRFHAALGDPLLDAGYYDQSHLIHEFREFSGTTPAAFVRERNALNDAFVGNFQDAPERKK